MFFYHPIKCFALFCLHSTLLAYNALIFNGVQRVDNSQKRVHYHLHLSALRMTEGGRSGAEFLLCGGGISVIGGRIFCRTDKFAAPPILFYLCGTTCLRRGRHLAAKSADKCNACRQWCILSTPLSARITY